jgi:transglutaminase-like putative cysteine protease
MEEKHKAVKELVGNVEPPVEETEEQKKKGPLRFIMAAFLIVIIAMWAIPAYGIKLDPNPKQIPTIAEVVPENLTYTSITTTTLPDHVIIDPEIKGVADRVATRACADSPDSKICYAKAEFYFVRDNFPYVSDPTHQEYIKTARESLVNQGGDCDDASVLLATLLKSIGIDTRFVFVPEHVYVEAWLPEALKKYKSQDDYVPLDATCKDCDFGSIALSYANAEKSYELVN